MKPRDIKTFSQAQNASVILVILKFLNGKYQCNKFSSIVIQNKILGIIKETYRKIKFDFFNSLKYLPLAEAIFIVIKFPFIKQLSVYIVDPYKKLTTLNSI
jgi:hypothetical protein